MLSLETEGRISKLFQVISEGEIAIEISRANLSSHSQFAPYQIFKRIDSESKNFITETNIVSFLQQNGIFSTIKEAKMIILFYDSDKSKSLTYSQFLNLIVSDSADIPRKINNKLYSGNLIPFAIEYCVCRIIENELNLIREIESVLDDIKQRKDFSAFDLYRTIKGEGEFVSGEVLMRFMRRNDTKVNYEDIKRIMKRLDIDRNGYVTCEDLECVFGLGLSEPNKNTLSTINANKSNFFSHNSTPTNALVREKISDNLFLRNVPERKNEYDIDNNKYTKESLFANSTNYHTSNPFINTSSSINTGEAMLISFIKMLMDIELKIEKLKCELSLRADFNIEDAYKIFTNTHSNFITQSDLKNGLHSLNIHTSYDDIQLLINKYSLNHDSVLYYNDLFDLLTPFNRTNRNEIESRTSSLVNKYNKSEVFLSTTKMCLVNLLNFIIETERIVEKERHKLNKNFSVNVRDIFNQIDKANRGSFSILDLNLFLKEKNVTFIPKEADLLFIRLDKERKGQIDLNAHVYEIKPITQYI